MTIKEVEEQTSLGRSNIRFYEKEKLIVPARNEKNGYREYSEEDIENIKKIAFLRTLNISIEEIRKIMSHEIELHDVISSQYHKLDTQIEELQSAKTFCYKILQKDNLNINDLKVEQYTDDIDTYWNQNHKVFQLDSVSWIYLWGGFTIWALLTALCFMIAIFKYPTLPEQIPVQWSGGNVSSSVGKGFIFAYPLACVMIRFLLRPFIRRWLRINVYESESITNYLVNFLCFVAFTAELFTILFLAGIVKHISVVLLIDAAVFLGLLLLSWSKFGARDKR